jgi:hypothetical protein
VSHEPNLSREASIGELMTQLSTQTSRLVRDELKLAQKELQATARHAGLGVGMFSAAGLLGVSGLGCGRAMHKAQPLKQAMADRAQMARAQGADLAAKAKDAATDHEGNVKPTIPGVAAAAGFLSVLAALVFWRRRR